MSSASAAGELHARRGMYRIARAQTAQPNLCSDSSGERTNHLSKIRKTVKSLLILTIAFKTDTSVAVP
jgi:hypothetical protein